MTLPDTIRPPGAHVAFEEYLETAFNARMTDIQAAVGRPQLRRLDAIVAERRRLADRYAAALASHPALAPPRERPWARGNWQSYPLTLRPGCGVTQIQALGALLGHGVAVRRGVHNAHQEPAYAGTDKAACHPSGCASPEACGGPARRCARLPASESARDGTILIPLFHGMTAAEQDHVIAACRTIGRDEGRPPAPLAPLAVKTAKPPDDR
jgi:dTDP-4-amino-4,6-dideoxygalactose transaminase